MFLTAEEQEMIEGLHGKTKQESMKVLVALGKIYGAEYMIPINSVHSPGVSYRVTGDAGLNYIKNASEDAVFCIPTTLNTIGVDNEDWEKIGFPEDFANKQFELNEAYKKMGAISLNTCIPYLAGSVPLFGEHVAWGESSAVAFANSVLGARTNREGGPSALAAAVTGRVPAYGYHLDENRKGEHLIQVEKDLVTDKDFAVLGYFAGKLAGKDVPVFNGIKRKPTLENLKALSAAVASSGAVALFHIVGITPEAPTLEEVWTKDPKEAVVFDDKAYNDVCGKFFFTGKVDFVVLGCPHTSITEMREIAGLLAGKTIRSGMWICTARQTKRISDEMGYSAIIQNAGAEIVCDTCPVLCYTLYDRKYETVATNSGKMAHYAPGHWNMQPLLLDTEDCIKAALNGKWEG